MREILQPEADRSVLLAAFTLRGAVFALDASSVHEVIRLGPLTPVCHAPAEVAGILNLRGRIVTILDIGLQLGMPKASPGADTRIIVMEHRNEFIGLLVDSVDDVLEVDPAAWDRPPANVRGERTRYFKAVCRVGGRVITLLDPVPFMEAAA